MSLLATAARIVLGVFLVVAGVAHQVAVEEFLGQTPDFLPWREAIVVVSGWVEIALGLALLLTRGTTRVRVGWVVAVFFVVVFPGNVWQLVSGSDSFGLDTTTGRVVRLFFQPVLVVWALWCTGALSRWDRWPRRAAGRGGSGPTSRAASR